MIVGGLTLPAAWTVNVAGTRAFVGGGFAFVFDDVPVDDVPAADFPVADVVVDLAVPRPPAPVRDPEVVVEALPDPAIVEVTDAEDDGAAVFEVCVELPHDAGSTAHVVATKRRASRLTLPA